MSNNDVIELQDLFQAVWSGKWFVLVITSLFLVFSTFYARSIPDQYRSAAILTPTSSSGGSSLSGLAGQFGGLASLAGVNINPGSGGGKTAIAMELLTTWGFLDGFVKSNQLEVEVFAAEGWDRKANKLIIDNTLYDVNAKSWLISTTNTETGSEELGPSSWALYGKIKNRINISQDINTGFISLSVEHFSPFTAKKWVDLLVSSINENIQLRDRTEALESIEYLKTQIGKTAISEMKTIFYQLIEEQTKTLMLAEISGEYVFKTLSPARVSEAKAKPKRSLIVVLGGFIGLMLSIMLVLVRYFTKRAD
jgi:capsular polysaccharide biosynthesis protein